MTKIIITNNEQIDKKRYIRDRVINKILTDKNHKEYVERLVAATLGIEKVNLELLSDRINTNTNIKNSIVDALYESKEVVVNIEVNISLSEYVKVKNTRYICHMLLKDIDVGGIDKLDKSIYQINLNYFDRYGMGEFISESATMEIKHHILRNDGIIIYDINLEKLEGISYNEIKKKERNSLEKLLYIFMCEDLEKASKLYNKDKIMREVADKMIELTKDFMDGLCYDEEKFRELVAYDDGKNERNIEIAKNLLNNPKLTYHDISNATGLSLKEIEKIAQELEN